MTYKNSSYFDGTLLRRDIDERMQLSLSRSGHPDLKLSQLSFIRDGRRHPLLRPPSGRPHLTTFALESILQNSDHDYARIPLEDAWVGAATVPAGDFDVALLSTTYIWNRGMLDQAMEWLGTNVPGIPVVAGGQYTNLKFMNAMQKYPELHAVVRGDAEVALPTLLDTLEREGDLARVPNLVWRDRDRIRVNAIEYIDLDAFPSPSFPGKARVVPYESMRGCPFDCKFCSFPFASPKWRYKSAKKIHDDWVLYAEENGAASIDAMDSTFTVPPTRLRQLAEILPNSNVPSWSCFSRANVIDSAEFLQSLMDSHCYHLEIGFESMNDETLRRMSKRVTVKQNRRAFDLLNRAGMSYGTSFMVGYPGETVEHFEDTRQFLVNEHRYRFTLHAFSISDETMPVWNDQEALEIQVEFPDDPDSSWSHIGMTSDDARKLQAETLDEVRRKNELAVASLWQREYDQPLLPEADRRANLHIEKAVERLAMSARDYSSVERAAAEIKTQLDRLRELGVEVEEAPSLSGHRWAGR